MLESAKDAIPKPDILFAWPNSLDIPWLSVRPASATDLPDLEMHHEEG
jgi:hypothetical protein